MAVPHLTEYRVIAQKAHLTEKIGRASVKNEIFTLEKGKILSFEELFPEKVAFRRHCLRKKKKPPRRNNALQVIFDLVRLRLAFFYIGHVVTIHESHSNTPLRLFRSGFSSIEEPINARYQF